MRLLDASLLFSFSIFFYTLLETDNKVNADNTHGNGMCVFCLESVIIQRKTILVLLFVVTNPCKLADSIVLKVKRMYMKEYDKLTTSQLSFAITTYPFTSQYLKFILTFFVNCTLRHISYALWFIVISTCTFFKRRNFLNMWMWLV